MKSYAESSEVNKGPILAGKRLHLVMNLGHEIVKVDTAFTAIWQADIKRIHQKCLAP